MFDSLDVDDYFKFPFESYIMISFGLLNTETQAVFYYHYC